MGTWWPKRFLGGGEKGVMRVKTSQSCHPLKEVKTGAGVQTICKQLEEEEGGGFIANIHMMRGSACNPGQGSSHT